MGNELKFVRDTKDLSNEEPPELYENKGNGPTHVITKNDELCGTKDINGSVTMLKHKEGKISPDNKNKVVKESTSNKRDLRKRKSTMLSENKCPTLDKKSGRFSTPKKNTKSPRLSVAPRTSSKKKKTKNDPEIQFETSWICAECKEAECDMVMNTKIDNSTLNDADKLLICDGQCQRLFHYPCAGLQSLPSEDESFVCSDCMASKHSCSLCQHYGIDNEDVFKCSKTHCGLFFHEACLSMQNVEVTITNEENRIFICPAHSCWTCTQIDVKNEQDLLDDLGIEDDENDDRNQTKNTSLKLLTRENAGTKSSLPYGLLPAICQPIPNNTLTTLHSQKQQIHQQKNKIKKKKCTQVSGIFETKTNRILLRCMICPTSYHMTCIPPAARFHELAILCHEHASTYKLPELVPEHSVQSLIEVDIDKKMKKHFSLEKYRSRKKGNTIDDEDVETDNYEKSNDEYRNPFFPGVSGFISTAGESVLIEKLKSKFDDFSDTKLFFCLPCDLKEEVHLKPPVYKHLQTNLYHPTNRPPRVTTSGLVMCDCTGFCGDDCLNRSLYVECYGDVRQQGCVATNCPVGPDCGNRLFSKRKFVRCKPKREEGKGWGLTICDHVKRGDLICEYVGEIIDAETKEHRLNEWTTQHPNDTNFYIMALQPGWFIDARDKGNLSRFINHSCEPNCVILPVNVVGRIRCGIIARRDIVAGEFLSYDYHFDTRHGDKFVCRCGSHRCRGTMQATLRHNNIQHHLGSGKKSKLELYEEAKSSFERDKKFLSDYVEEVSRRSNLVAETVPGADTNEEITSHGPQRHHRIKARQYRLFLWRNVELGSNFAARFSRLTQK